ncbi:DUF3895 domain-containing protein [Paenibacillus harenae]|uniref:DUF3895 domain-containing protein n=1 Tax=Paenibacillus harenae TaxID=306543 RepID=UPI00146BB839|nr:DUF3895 domain-containing protein [Paenibacillus harenae]
MNDGGVMMNDELTIEQRDRILGQMTEEQRHFIHHELVRGRRTLFARQLARKKCQFIPEDARFEDIESFIEEWDYIGFTDSGEVSPHTKCECGRSLRYQHQVMHLPTNTMRYFGIEHLQLHTGIDAKTISAIMKGFDVLDAEMNEILCKYRDGWQLGQHVFLPLPDALEIPPDIQAHLDVELPLLGKQLARLRSRLRELDQADRQKRIAAALTHFEPAVQIAKEEPDHGGLDITASGMDAAEAPMEGQAAFDFDFVDANDNQVAFLFDEAETGQAAFLFEEPKLTPSAPLSSKDTGVKQGFAVNAGQLGGYMPTASNPFHLPANARRVIDEALPYGRISTRAVSEFMIEQKLVQDSRMTTGKPAIYIAVAAYLDKLAWAGKCELAAADAEDRIYTPL